MLVVCIDLCKVLGYDLFALESVAGSDVSSIRSSRMLGVLERVAVVPDVRRTDLVRTVVARAHLTVLFPVPAFLPGSESNVSLRPLCIGRPASSSVSEVS